MSESLDQPQCKICFKLLPWSFQGQDMCAWCLYNGRVAESTQLHSKAPSYHTPYDPTENGNHGDDERSPLP